MTVILGLLTETHALIGYDSRVVAGDELVSDEFEKGFACGDWFLAATGSSRLNSVLRAAGETLAAQDDPWALSLAIREALKADGYVGAPLDGDGGDGRRGPLGHHYGGLLIAGGRRKGDRGLWSLDLSMTPRRVSVMRPYGHGTGCAYAQGAAWDAVRRCSGSTEAVAAGLLAACAYSTSCGGQLVIRRMSLSSGDAMVYVVGRDGQVVELCHVTRGRPAECAP